MRRIAILVAVLALLVVPTTAFAQDNSTCEAYNPQLCTSHTENNSNSTLPFTGLDVALLALGGGALLGAGLVVRRVSRRLN
jgi:hypothetical protein